MSARIRVLVADDSPFVCRLLSSYVNSTSDMEVMATAPNGRRAVEMVHKLRPAVVTMDLEMPQMDGLEAVGLIMRDRPTPIVAISGVSGRAATMTLQALDLGAVDFILKFTPGVHTQPHVLRKEIVGKIRAASKVHVIRSLAADEAWVPEGQVTASRGALIKTSGVQQFGERAPHAELPAGGLVVVGASTGGPITLREMLSELPADYGASMIIVQHMPRAFTSALAAQLKRYAPLPVREACEGDSLQPGTVLIAPGGFHLLLRPDLKVTLHRGPEIAGHCPSIDVAMQSAAQLLGPAVTGVILTGMGDDGAMGLKEIRAKGGMTYAQDAATCVVNGMPQRAIELGVVSEVAPPKRIARMLVEQAKHAWISQQRGVI